MVVSFMGSSFLSWWSFSFDRTEARISSVERGSVLQVHSASFPNILLVHRDPRQVGSRRRPSATSSSGSGTIGRPPRPPTPVSEIARTPGPPPRRRMGWESSGPLEAEVVREVWAASSPTAVGPIREALNVARARPLAYTTVQTVMARLVAKGVLVRIRKGRADLYEATGPDAAGLAVRRLPAEPVRNVAVERRDHGVDQADHSRLSIYGCWLPLGTPGRAARCTKLVSRLQIDTRG